MRLDVIGAFKTLLLEICCLNDKKRSVQSLQEDNSKLMGRLEGMQKLESLYKDLEGKSASLQELWNNL